MQPEIEEKHTLLFPIQDGDIMAADSGKTTRRKLIGKPTL